MLLFSVGSEKEFIEVVLPDAAVKKARYDGVMVSVNIGVGGFSGAVEVSIGISDVVRLKEQLEPVYRDVSGVAEFTTIEQQIYICVEVDKLGHVKATGYLIDRFYDGNKLEFCIKYDQTLLWHTISEIDEAIFELSQKTV